MSAALVRSLLGFLQGRAGATLLTLAMGGLLWWWQNWNYRRRPFGTMTTPHRWLLGLDPPSTPPARPTGGLWMPADPPPVPDHDEPGVRWG